MRHLGWLLLLAFAASGCVMSPAMPPGFSSTWQRQQLLSPAPPVDGYSVPQYGPTMPLLP